MNPQEHYHVIATGDGAILALMQKLKTAEDIITRAKLCLVCFAFSDEAPINTLIILEEYEE